MPGPGMKCTSKPQNEAFPAWSVKKFSSLPACVLDKGTCLYSLTAHSTQSFIISKYEQKKQVEEDKRTTVCLKVELHQKAR